MTEPRSSWPTTPTQPTIPGWGESPPAPSATLKSHDERRAILGQAVQAGILRGGRIESQSDYQAVLVFGKRVNHILHLLLSVLLLGIWLIVWILLIATGGERRELVAVDEAGNVTWRKLPK